MKNLFLFLGLFISFAFQLNAEDTAVLGDKVTDSNEIKEGVYAICGLLNCDPVNGVDGTKGRFYRSNKAFKTEFQPSCTFMLVPTGEDDGTFYIRSMYDGKYWASCTNENYLGKDDATIFKSMAAKVKFVPNDNDGLPGSMVIYEYIPEAESNPYVIAQDWGSSGFGWSAYSSLEENDNTGMGEWYLYNVTMDAPYKHMLENLMNTVNTLGLVESKDPGRYADLGSLPEIMKDAESLITEIEESEAKSIVEDLSEAIDAISNIGVNPVVEGVYVIENAYNAFLLIKKSTKSICFEPNENFDIESDYIPFWKSTPDDIYTGDSLFHIELISAADTKVANNLLNDGAITKEQMGDLYFLKNPKTGYYIGCTTDKGLPIGVTKDAVYPYLITSRGDAVYNILFPELPGYSLGCFEHKGGNGEDNYIEYANSTAQGASWKLRYVSERNTTSVLSAGKYEGAIVSVIYYNVCGVASDVPVKGLNIVKCTYADGSVKTSKIIK